MPDTNTSKAVILAYSGGSMSEGWKSKRDKGLWPVERAQVIAHCKDLTAAVCNIGCGAGRETFGMYAMGFVNIRGYDCTAAMLEGARERAKVEALDIGFDQAAADSLPCPDGTFDVVTLFENVYGHITPRQARHRALCEIRRVLKPGGIVMMAVTSLHDSLVCRAYFSLARIVRAVWNPYNLEPGDKFMARHRWGLAKTRSEAPRSHYFLPHEVLDDARAAGLFLVQETTSAGILAAPGTVTDPRHLRGMGRLLYVLARPLDSANR